MGKPLDAIVEALGDLTSLEVITYRGTIALTLDDKKRPDFEKMLAASQAAGTMKIIAATNSRVDGDLSTFMDTDATTTDLATHHQFVESAIAKRQALLELLKTGLIERLK